MAAAGEGRWSLTPGALRLHRSCLRHLMTFRSGPLTGIRRLRGRDFFLICPLMYATEQIAKAVLSRIQSILFEKDAFTVLLA